MKGYGLEFLAINGKALPSPFYHDEYGLMTLLYLAVSIFCASLFGIKKEEEA